MFFVSLFVAASSILSNTAHSEPCSDPWNNIDCAIQTAELDHLELNVQLTKLLGPNTKYDSCKADVLYGIIGFVDQYLQKLYNIKAQNEENEAVIQKSKTTVLNILKLTQNEFNQEVDPVYPAKEGKKVKLNDVIGFINIIRNRLNSDDSAGATDRILRQAEDPRSNLLGISIKQVPEILTKLNQFLAANELSNWKFVLEPITKISGKITLEGNFEFFALDQTSTNKKISLEVSTAKSELSVNMADLSLQILEFSVTSQNVSWNTDLVNTLFTLDPYCPKQNNPIISHIQAPKQESYYYSPIFDKNITSDSDIHSLSLSGLLIDKVNFDVSYTLIDGIWHYYCIDHKTKQLTQCQISSKKLLKLKLDTDHTFYIEPNSNKMSARVKTWSTNSSVLGTKETIYSKEALYVHVRDDLHFILYLYDQKLCYLWGSGIKYPIDTERLNSCVTEVLVK